MKQIEQRPMKKTDTDLNMLYDLFAQDEGLRRTMSSLKWQYFKNPTEKIYAQFAVDKKDSTEEPAAFYALCPLRFKAGASTTTAGLSLDTFTGINYRRMGLFTKLADEVYRKCQKQGISLIFGFPNANSATGFFKRLGWSSLGPLPLYVKPLRLSVFVRAFFILAYQLLSWRKIEYSSGKLPFSEDFKERITCFFSRISMPFSRYQATTDDGRIQILKNFSDHRIDELWKQFSERIPYTVVRDAQYLNWRFVDRPPRTSEAFGRIYTSAAYYENTRMQGFVSYRTKMRKGICYGYIMDLIYEPQRHKIGHTLLGYAVNDMHEQGAEMILAYNFQHSPNHTPFRTNHFFYLPERYRPFEFYFGTKNLALANNFKARVAQNWYISFSDLDTI